jgi:hypothetical protein
MINRISIKLTRKEWTGLTGLVLSESANMKNIDDRYYRALMEHLLRTVYVKLHNKLHSLKESKNALSLNQSEAAAFNMVFADETYEAPNPFAQAILTSIINQIDRSLA